MPMLESKYRCLRSQEQGFTIDHIEDELIAEAAFRTVSEPICRCFLQALGAVFLIYVVPKLGVNINRFSSRNMVRTATSGPEDCRNTAIRSPLPYAPGEQGPTD